MNLAVNFAGVSMKNPVTTASGTFGSGAEYGEYVDLNRLERCGKCTLARQSNTESVRDLWWYVECDRFAKSGDRRIY